MLLWKLGVMPLLFYDMLLARCSVYYAVVTLLFVHCHTVLVNCCENWRHTPLHDESLCQDDIAA
ncbi:hypothetical protein ACVNPZ_06985 [Staphylococcus aureus]